MLMGALANPAAGNPGVVPIPALLAPKQLCLSHASDASGITDTKQAGWWREDLR